MYCDKYITTQKKLQKLLKQSSLYQEQPQIDSAGEQKDKKIKEIAPLKKSYRVYSFLFEDGTEYLIYTSSKKEGCQAIGKSLSSLKRKKLVAKKFFLSIYLEQENGIMHHYKI